MRVVFMGTPDFAVPSLQSLAESGYEIVGVVTQPDRPRGRGKKIIPSPVKIKATELGLRVYQPDRIRESSFVSMLKGLNPDLVAVVAFGQILPTEILELPPLGCVNVHASLLPKYRGAAPIQRAIMDGVSETGITTMKMDKGLDTGDMLLVSRTPIESDENFGSVHDRLSVTGAHLLVETLEQLKKGHLTGCPQDDEKATYAPPISRDDEIIDWRKTAQEIKNQIRALDPWPGARTGMNGKVLKIWKASVYQGKLSNESGGASVQPGCIMKTAEQHLIVQCKDHPLLIQELQIEGGKRMSAGNFLRGITIIQGTILG